MKSVSDNLKAMLRRCPDQEIEESYRDDGEIKEGVPTSKLRVKAVGPAPDQGIGDGVDTQRNGERSSRQ